MATAEELRRAREETAFGGLASGLFEYMRERDQMLQDQGRRPVLGGLLSKEPVMGTDTLRYEGVMPLIAGLLEPIVRGVDAPRAASQNLIPQEDMIGEAYGTAGAAMLGGGAAAKPAGSLGMNVLRDTPNEMRSNQVLVRIPVKDVEHGESAMPGGKLTWPDAPKLIEEYARQDTDLPPIEIMADESGMAMIADGSHRFEAAKLRGQDYVEAYVNTDDLAELPSAEVLSANASKSAGLLGQTMFTDDVYHYMKSPTMEGDVLDTSRSSGRLNRLGPHVGTARAAEERFEGLFGIRPDQTALLEMSGYNTPTEKIMAYLSEVGETTGTTLPLRARLDQPFLNKDGKPFSESDLLDALNRYADQNNIQDLDAATDMFRKDLTDSGFTNIPYINDFEDAGSVSHIMLTDRTAGDPAVLRSRFAAFEDAYDPSIMAANASKPLGILVLEQQARGNERLGGLLQSQGMDINDLSTADPLEIEGVLDMAARRGILDKRSAAGLKRGLLD